jgi:hypothetical protein
MSSIVAGREFIDTNAPNAQLAVIVNQAFVHKFLGSANPVGRYFSRIGQNLLIVGVVGDTVLTPTGRLNADAEPLTKEEAIYIPAAQLRNFSQWLTHGFSRAG